ncbi:MAG: hypothetical protein HC899_35120 [Leptolyngbyaceae cyanobacterium SM1_4_3]|nr:hypothetical protein [Leptolyngbyaceae cyanobacterium SM1_4_3]
MRLSIEILIGSTPFQGCGTLVEPGVTEHWFFQVYLTVPRRVELYVIPGYD